VEAFAATYLYWWSGRVTNINKPEVDLKMGVTFPPLL
jgi:hypothetical protein